MKRIFISGLACLTGFFTLAGCSGTVSNDISDSTSTSDIAVKDEKIKIVTAIFPEYDWVNNIIGERSDNFEVTLLCDNGTDMHSYQPSVEDITKISDSDLFIYTGGESDEWIADALKNTDDSFKSLNLLEVLGDKLQEEEHIGVAETGHEDHDHDHQDTEYDEHIWLSLKNAETLCGNISEAIKQTDPDNAAIYDENAKAYVNQLEQLDRKYKETVEGSAIKTLLFADRFPFLYMTKDYGIDHYAAFNGCEAETEASFETIIFLSGKIEELDLKNVMVIEGSDKRLAETVISNTKNKDQSILELDSMQSVTKQDIESGMSYLSVMEENLKTLGEALGSK